MSKNDVNNLRVIVGDQDIKNSFDVMSAKTYTVKRVVRHKNFDINTLFHDVAVLSLAQDINYDYSVQSICLDRQPNHNYQGTTVQGSIHKRRPRQFWILGPIPPSPCLYST